MYSVTESTETPKIDCKLRLKILPIFFGNLPTQFSFFGNVSVKCHT